MNPNDSLHIVLDRQAAMRRDMQVMALARNARLLRKARRIALVEGPVDAVVAVAPARPARTIGGVRAPIIAAYGSVQ